MNVTSNASPRRRLLLVAAAAVLAAPIALLMWSAGASENPPVITASGPAQHLQWRAGAQRDYEVRMHSDVELGEAGAHSRYQLRARLAMRVFNVAEQSVEVAFELADVRFAATGTRDNGLELALQTPFLAEFASDGAIRAFRFPAGMDADVRRQLEELVRTFEVVVADGAAGEWTSTEEHGSGRYRADYRALGKHEIQKTKSVYVHGAVLRDRGQDVGATDTHIKHSRAVFHLAQDSVWLDDANVDEELEFRSEGQLMARVATVTDLVAAGGHLDSDLARAPDAAAMLAEAQVVLPDRAQAPAVPPRPATAADIEAFEQRISAFRASDGEDINLLHELAEQITAIPELAAGIPALLARERVGDRAAAGLIHALELAGNGDSQSALLLLLADQRRSRRTQLRAIVALGGLTEPTPEVIATLWQTVERNPKGNGDGLANTSLLALGQLGRALADRDVEAYAELRRQMVQTMEASATPQGRAVALKAIGNIGDSALLPAVAPRLADGAAVVRGAAAHALGAMDTNDSLTALTQHLSRESDARVRMEIARSFRRMKTCTAETFAACATLVAGEGDPDARGAMARYLVDHLADYPDGRDVLQSLIATETQPSTLSYVAGRLYR